MEFINTGTEIRKKQVDKQIDTGNRLYLHKKRKNIYTRNNNKKRKNLVEELTHKRTNPEHTHTHTHT